MKRREAVEMPFLDHLEELRWRIIWSLAAVLIGMMVSLGLLLSYHEQVLTWLQSPILPYLHGRRLMNTHPGAGMSILVNVAVVIGVLLALPMIVYQAWAFLSPALHQQEKRIIAPVAAGAVILYVCGAALAWYYVLPMTLRVLTGIGEGAFDQMISAREYFGFALTMVLLTWLRAIRFGDIMPPPCKSGLMFLGAAEVAEIQSLLARAKVETGTALRKSLDTLASFVDEVATRGATRRFMSDESMPVVKPARAVVDESHEGVVQYDADHRCAST